jgi:hypothetical protein
MMAIILMLTGLVVMMVVWMVLRARRCSSCGRGVQELSRPGPS